MNPAVHLILSALLAFATQHQPITVDEAKIDDYCSSLIESFEHNLLDSCLVLLERLEENALLSGGSVPQNEFRTLFELLDSIEPEAGSYEADYLEQLKGRTRAAFASYIHNLDELPGDIDPSFIRDEIDAVLTPRGLDGFDDGVDGLELIENIEIGLDGALIDTSHKKLPSIEFVRNKKVENTIEYFNTKGRKVMQLWLDRSAEMIPILLPILREQGMPEELVYLSMIESGFNTHAYSYAHAAGPWQFISETGRRYGLDIDWWYDERRDPYLSTKAACDYLRVLYNLFDDWYLALAAYNCGEGKVKRHVKSYSNDYWSLYKLPRQTRNYVPTFIGAAIIAQNPEEYGFTIPDPVEPPKLETVFINECVDMGSLAKAAGTEKTTLTKYNPAIVRWCTPPYRDSVKVYLPVGALAEGFSEKFAQIPPEKKVSYIRHQVNRGETLSTIARRYGVPMSLIINEPRNNIKSQHRIRAGQILIIPGISTESAKYTASIKSEPVSYPSGGSYHIVRRGESLSSIAAAYGTSVNQLKRLNGLWGKRYIYPKQRLRISTESDAVADEQQSKEIVTVPESGRSHFVKRGDTLWDISRKYGVSVDDLKRANGLRGRAVIKPGQRLLIPG
jgi:membrane-bound lytic murein transglycosylase D